MFTGILVSQPGEGATGSSARSPGMLLNTAEGSRCTPLRTKTDSVPTARRSEIEKPCLNCMLGKGTWAGLDSHYRGLAVSLPPILQAAPGFLLAHTST